MGIYKVIYRAESAEGAEHRVKWEQGCPLLFEAIQISRNTETGQAYLQSRVVNVGAKPVSSFKAVLKCAYRDGKDESFEIEPLDADVPSGGTYELKPLELSQGDAVSVDAAVTWMMGEAWEWTSLDTAEDLPSRKSLELSEAAIRERACQLEERGCKVSLAAAHYVLERHDGWTLCACGQVNVGTQSCVSCGLRHRECGLDLDDESALMESARMRAEKEKRAQEVENRKRAKRRKTAKRVIPIVASFLVVAVTCATAYSLGYLGGEPQAQREEREAAEALAARSRERMEPYLAYLNTEVSSSLVLDMPDNDKILMSGLGIMGVSGEIESISAKDGMITSVMWSANESMDAARRDEFIDSLDVYFDGESSVSINTGEMAGYEYYSYTYTWDDASVPCEALLEYTYMPDSDEPEDEFYYSIEWVSAEDGGWLDYGVESVEVV